MPVLFPGGTRPASPAATSARESKPSCVMSPALFSAPRIGQQVGTTTRRQSQRSCHGRLPGHRLTAQPIAVPLSPVIELYCLPALDQYSIEKKRFTVGERRVRECGL